jgi:Dehydrogenase E1 component
MLDSHTQHGRKTQSTGKQRGIPKRIPPVPKAVLRQLYRALLTARLAREQSPSARQSVPDGMVVAATLPLRSQDLLIPPPDALVLRQCEALESSLPNGNKFPHVLRVAPRAHWQIAMAMHMAQGSKHRRRWPTAVLTIVPEDFLAGARREATLELLGEASQQKLPVVYVTRTPESRGARRASDLQTGGVPRIPVDGGDVVAIYRVCQEALRRAREGTGPTLVDCHFMGSADDVSFLETFMERYGLWSPAWKQQLLREVREAHPTRTTARPLRAASANRKSIS